MGLRPKPRGGFAARANYWGLRPDPRWGSAPNPVQEAVLGREPRAGSGAEPPATFLRRSRPGVWGGAPNRRGPLAPLWLRHWPLKFSQIEFEREVK